MNKLKVTLTTLALSLLGLAAWAQTSPEAQSLLGYGDGGAFKVQLAGPISLSNGVLTVNSLGVTTVSPPLVLTSGTLSINSLPITSVTSPLNLSSGVLSTAAYPTTLPRFSLLTSESSSFSAVTGQAFYETSSSASTATLPTAVGVAGSEILIKNTGSNTVTMASTSAQTIDGASAGSTTITTGTSKNFISDGANWWSE